MLAARNITVPTPIQALAIPDALAGKDVCGKAQTGSGKTLAFGLPLLERTPVGGPGSPSAIVLVPTRELAAQVATAFAPIAAIRGLRLAAIYGGVSLQPQIQMLRGRIDVVVGTPGRINDLIARRCLNVADVAIVVIDEADQMADMGFLPQVERIVDQIEPGHQTLLFSATLDGAVDRLIRRYQTDPVFHDVATPVEEQPVMQHRFIGVQSSEKVAVAAAIASGPERTLFFVRTQRAADRLAMQLERERLPVGRIHGRLSQAQRDRAMRAFASGELPVLVATNIAARGIHVDDVGLVVHFDPPEDAKTYLHRSGRTARAGASGVVVTLVEPEELRAVNSIRREAGIKEAIVMMGASDERLGALAEWSPPLEEHKPLPPSGPVSIRRTPWPARDDARRHYGRPAPAGPILGQRSRAFGR